MHHYGMQIIDDLLAIKDNTVPMNVQSEKLANFLDCRPRKINIIVEFLIIEINSRKFKSNT
jgi:hypothetical protein